jgi:hypothetical protein
VKNELARLEYVLTYSSIGPLQEIDEQERVSELGHVKNYSLIPLMYVVSKVFEKVLKVRLINHLLDSGILDKYQYDFRSNLEFNEIKHTQKRRKMQQRKWRLRKPHIQSRA